MKKINLIMMPIVLVLAILSIYKILLPSVNAVEENTIYAYDFRNAGFILHNQADESSSSLTMSLYGSWTSDAIGTNFTGNTTSTRSVGYAKPSNSTTISVGTAEAVGAGVVFIPKKLCHSDSQNVTQIGLFATGASQVKLQLSKCANSYTYPECRISGALTPAGTGALRGTLKLAANQKYYHECVKSPDNGTSAQVTMRTTLLSTGVTSTKTFTIPDTGAVTSSAYLSVAGKYPYKALSTNTDQFTGVVSKIAYCKGSDVATAQSCLGSATSL